ncbi:histone-arginine methyltransferase CARMER-like [Porites lutea]
MDPAMNVKAGMKSQTFRNCRLQIVTGEYSLSTQDGGECVVDVFDDTNNNSLDIRIRSGNEYMPSFKVTRESDHCQIGRLRYLIDLPEQNLSVLLSFTHREDVVDFKELLNATTGRMKKRSVFNERTEKASASQYFQFYGYLSQQQNMMQDYIRTSTYQRAMLQNCTDFQDKVVIDVGAGSGILSFFAVQAGARKVYAIEASTMATHAEALIKQNNLSDKVILIPGKVEEVEIPEKVDVIISEPMGYMLYNERMLESYLHAKKWLKPDGKMFPTRGDLHVAPFFDDALYMEHFSKANFWYQNSFYGVDLSNLRDSALEEYFRQPIVDTFDVRILMAKPVTHTVDFLSAAEEDLHRIEIPLHFVVHSAGTVHGLAFWFDVLFQGSSVPVWLSTAPQEPLTHWYQVRCLLRSPLFVKVGQSLSGKVLLISNRRQSYDVEIEVSVDGTNIKSTNSLDLKNPYFRYTGSQTVVPAGTNTVSPTELYWNSSVAGVNENGLDTGSCGALMGNGLGIGTVGSYSGAGGILGASPYALGGIPSGMPVVSAVPNATSLEGNSSHYVTNRYVVGNQAAIVHGYSGTSCGEYISSKGAYHSMVYSR